MSSIGGRQATGKLDFAGRLARLLILPPLLAAGVATVAAAENELEFVVKPEVVHRQLDGKTCWFHPRAAAIPGAGRDGAPAVIMTVQKHLKVSDFYSGMWVMRTDDLGKTWSGPKEQPELAWVREPDGVVVAVADVTPGWHAPSGKLLAIGARVRYSPKGAQLSDVKRAHQTAYAVYDPKTDKWSKWTLLEMPPEAKFDFARNACSQWLVEKDGSLLLPVYFAKSAKVPFSVTVMRFSFDGRTLSFVEHGDELKLNVVRGLCEPSLVKFQGRYYLTLRNDLKGYVTAGDDGLHFGPIKLWAFDDGTELGSYNTQQHWVAHRDGLFLVYTRRGADNDDIMRHRAPLFIARVDAEKLTVLRNTERVVVPNRGATLGNFGACRIDENQCWVTVGEFYIGTKPHARGADGSIFVSRIIWAKPDGR